MLVKMLQMYARTMVGQIDVYRVSARRPYLIAGERALDRHPLPPAPVVVVVVASAAGARHALAFLLLTPRVQLPPVPENVVVVGPADVATGRRRPEQQRGRQQDDGDGGCRTGCDRHWDARV